MAIAKKPLPKKRPLMVSSLAAKLLGHSRVTGLTAFSTRQLTLTFPAFNALEMANALSELVDKELLKQKGDSDHATYSLTDYGREGRVSVG